LRCHAAENSGEYAEVLRERLNRSAVSIRAALSGALAVCLIPIGTAQAERFGPQYRSWEGYEYAPFSPYDRSWGTGDYEPFRQKRHRAHTKHESRPKTDSQRQRAAKSHESEPKTKSQEVAKGPLEIIISIADQRISVYDDGTLIGRSSVSTGVQGHPTPIGVFSVIGKELWHRSNIYSAAPMPYMQRITWSGIALHAGVLPGHPASHGCIRLANDFAVRLWRLTKRGTRVIIARHDVQPVQIASPRLFSKPKTASSSQGSSTEALAEKDVPTVASTPASLAQPQDATNALPTTGVGPQKKAVPISVFVSRKLSTLFVRQGFTPLFDVPIKIENPDEPLGTHVFTLMELQSEGTSFRWNVVSLPENFSSTSPNLNKKPKASVQASGGTVRADPLPDDGIVALDRIEIPQDGVARISQLLTPGSSLIVSDYGLSSETGSDTDFIVVIP
jgi:lipoprotein-anchoring transpeptidase ErfK/SrfK